MKYGRLFAPLDLGFTRLANRIVMEPIPGSKISARFRQAGGILRSVPAVRRPAGEWCIAESRRLGQPFRGKLSSPREIARHRLVTEPYTRRAAESDADPAHRALPPVSRGAERAAPIDRFRPRELSSDGVREDPPIL
jgi:hypothetical protein